ncbi:MAG: 3-phosphoshikimate 1-carboxyvinyltransferase [Peptococcaceae bacterium]|nr:3-phosphoshikimate 1-carboxyvinyltransferase [Peptococcaceae bacterium]
MDKVVKPINLFHAQVAPPGDKSISHRAILLLSLVQGVSSVVNLSLGADVLSSMQCMKQLGVCFKREGAGYVISSPGLRSFTPPSQTLDCGNSGTTMRLLAGILAGSGVHGVLSGDASLNKRPMLRVVEPLCAMGALITAAALDTPPLSITGSSLKGIHWRPSVASAQVKSAILLAGLSATGQTEVVESYPTRDHTERMLKVLGANIVFQAGLVAIVGQRNLQPANLSIPGDFSSAAYFLVLAAMMPDSTFKAENVGLNEGRTGLLEVLEKMGVQVSVEVQDSAWEPVGSIKVQGAALRGFEISGALVPRLIDEIPILAVAACMAQGRSVVHDAAELRAKESDRISQLLSELRKMGAQCEEHADGFTIEGGCLRGAVVESHGDHRLAMALTIAGLVASGTTIVRDAECVDISYPEFWIDLESIRGEQSD